MPYVQQSDIVADIPPQFLLEALDDNGDGIQDTGLWDLIAQQVSDAIDGYLGLRYAVPIPPLGDGSYFPVILNAGRVLACEKLYGRRGQYADKNPWAARANAVRSQLNLISKGQLPLDPTENRKDPSASVQTSRMQTVPRGERLMI